MFHHQLSSFELKQDHLFSLFLTDINDAGIGSKFIFNTSLQNVKHNLASRLQCSPPLVPLSVHLSVFQPSPLSGATWLGLTGEGRALSPHFPAPGNFTGQQAGVATNPADWSVITILDFGTFWKPGQNRGLSWKLAAGTPRPMVQWQSTGHPPGPGPLPALTLNPAEMTSNWAARKRKGCSKGSQCELTGLRGSGSTSTVSLVTQPPPDPAQSLRFSSADNADLAPVLPLLSSSILLLLPSYLSPTFWFLL